MIEENHLGPLEDGLAIAEGTALGGYRAAVHAKPEAIGTSRGFRRAIIQVPDLYTTRIIPVDPLAVDRVIPVLLQWQSGAGFVAELSRTVFAIADAVTVEPAPAIVGESFRMAALDN